MTAPPSGTLAFLFTDVEGSTRLWEASPEAMRPALVQHDAIVRKAIEEHGGYVFTTSGDSFSAAFGDALPAVDAAVAAQQALADHDFGGIDGLAVRMAIHSGVAHERDGDYFGQALNRCARILAVGHGGQVLLSLAAEELLRDRLGPMFELRDLGDHRLKDLGRPERIFQLEHPGLPEDFPALASLASHNHNLPVQLSSFVGRDQEVSDLVKRLADNRLVTLTGVGGSGKTRLALQAAAERIGEYPGGVWFVELAPVGDPERIADPAAAALGLTGTGGQVGEVGLGEQTLTELVVERLRTSEALLVLDNCEHLISAAARFASTVLRSCPGVSIVATSREGLALPGETLVQVPSLGLPIEEGEVTDAMVLFAERAAAIDHTFELDGATRPSVARICERLDGMPLAIELAAARARVLTADQIAERLDDRFRLLTGGSRTAVERQQTLLATVDWSFDLLSPDEQLLFARLAAFRGGFTLDAAETVAAGGEVQEWHVLDLVGQLVEKSMVTRGVRGRFEMLETLRQYALGKLTESDEVDAVRSRHAEFMAALAAESEPALRGPDQGAWFGRLDDEIDNLRAALDYLFEHGRADSAAAMVANLCTYWGARNLDLEGAEWVELAEPHAEELDDATAVQMAGWATNMATLALRTEQAQRLEDLALARAEQSGNADLIGSALIACAWNRVFCSDVNACAGFAERALRHLADSTDLWRRALAHFTVGWARRYQLDLDGAAAELETAAALAREIGASRILRFSLSALGIVARYRGDFLREIDVQSEVLALAEADNDRGGMCFAIGCRGLSRMLLGQTDAALDDMERALRISRTIGGSAADAELHGMIIQAAHGHRPLEYIFDHLSEGLVITENDPGTYNLCLLLEQFAAVVEEQGRPDLAAVFLGYASEQRRLAGRAIPPNHLADRQALESRVLGAVGAESFGSRSAEGARLGKADALALAQRVAAELRSEIAAS